jgi:enhancing lycopene biosynthesis protein 2
MDGFFHTLIVMKKIAVILSGCGVYDGAEISESILTLLALSKAGAHFNCFAPDILQHHVVNHCTGEPATDEARNVLVESARITRGQIKPLSELRVEDFDGVVLPGGYGAAKNLCSLAFDGSNYKANEALVTILQAFHASGKAQGFMCIAPAVAAAALGSANPSLTIGNDADTGTALSAKGAIMKIASVTDVVIDAENKIVSTPAYMLADNLVDLEKGITEMIRVLLELA